MNSLTDVYETISAADAELLEKQAAHIKQAEEEDAAGRIMARGFMDELHKLAQEPAVQGFSDKTNKMTKAPSIKANYSVGTGATGPSGITRRTPVAPPLPPGSAAAGTAPNASFSRQGGLRARPPAPTRVAGGGGRQPRTPSAPRR